jgi:hypothetical protein
MSYYKTESANNDVSLKVDEISTAGNTRGPHSATRGSGHNQPEENPTDPYEQKEIKRDKSHTGKHTRPSTEVTNSDSATPRNQPHVTAEPTPTQSSVARTTDAIFLTLDGQSSGRTVIQQEPVPGEKHIIFLETRCVLNDSISSNQLGLVVERRGACAVASAADTNPNMKVYLLHTCPVHGDLGASPQYVKQMLSYPNVRVWKLTVPDYMKGTPLENWDFLGKVNSSLWPLQHSSDILRYVTLWKYGGTYADLDFVFLK